MNSFYMALYLWDVIHLVGVHLDEPGYPRFLASASVQNLKNDVLKMTNILKLLLQDSVLIVNSPLYLISLLDGALVHSHIGELSELALL